jgi:hypothetical protein
MTEREILELIRSNDPDGKAKEPTPKDYADFKSWVLNTYGRQAWSDYHTNWDMEG